MLLPTYSIEMHAPLAGGLSPVEVAQAFKAEAPPTFGSITFRVAKRVDGTRPTPQEIEAIWQQTHDWAIAAQEASGIPIAAHLTTLPSIEQIRVFADALWAAGIRHILALGGDNKPASGGSTEYYDTAAELITGLRKLYNFDITVAVSIENNKKFGSLDESMKAAIEGLKSKIDAGANRALTQFFFINRDYGEFLMRAVKSGIRIEKTPIIPGFMPILSIKNPFKFVEENGVTIPAEVRDYFQKAVVAGKLDEAASAFLAQQMDYLKVFTSHFHFYSRNQVDIWVPALKRVGIIASTAKARLSSYFGPGPLRAREPLYASCMLG